MASKKAPPLVYEVLEKVSRARTPKTKLNHLEKYDSPALRTILLLNYHPEMKFVEFPEAEYLKTEKPSSNLYDEYSTCLLYTSPSPRDQRGSRMPSSA